MRRSTTSSSRAPARRSKAPMPRSPRARKPRGDDSPQVAELAQLLHERRIDVGAPGRRGIARDVRLDLEQQVRHLRAALVVAEEQVDLLALIALHVVELVRRRRRLPLMELEVVPDVLELAEAQSRSARMLGA